MAIKRIFYDKYNRGIAYQDKYTRILTSKRYNYFEVISIYGLTFYEFSIKLHNLDLNSLGVYVQNGNLRVLGINKRSLYKKYKIKLQFNGILSIGSCYSEDYLLKVFKFLNDVRLDLDTRLKHRDYNNLRVNNEA